MRPPCLLTIVAASSSPTANGDVTKPLSSLKSKGVANTINNSLHDRVSAPQRVREVPGVQACLRGVHAPAGGDGKQRSLEQLRCGGCVSVVVE